MSCEEQDDKQSMTHCSNKGCFLKLWLFCRRRSNIRGRSRLMVMGIPIMNHLSFEKYFGVGRLKYFKILVEIFTADFQTILILGSTQLYANIKSPIFVQTFLIFGKNLYIQVIRLQVYPTFYHLQALGPVTPCNYFVFNSNIRLAQDKLNILC